jgi:hypothetical protein
LIQLEMLVTDSHQIILQVVIKVLQI